MACAGNLSTPSRRDFVVACLPEIVKHEGRREHSSEHGDVEHVPCVPGQEFGTVAGVNVLPRSAHLSPLTSL